MANELSDIRIRIEDEVYSHRVEFPKLSTKILMLNICVIKILKLKPSRIHLNQVEKEGRENEH